MAKKTSRNVYWLWLSAVIVIADQITKALVRKHFELYEYEVITPFFDLIRLHNTGAAFSFLSDAGGWQQYLFIGLALLVSTVIVFWLRGLNGKQLIVAFGLSLLLGGALGNVIDRVALSYVTDFLYFHWNDHYWPAFNIADIAICVGAGALIFDAFISKNDDASASTDDGVKRR